MFFCHFSVYHPPILEVVTLPNGGVDTLATLSPGGELNVISGSPLGGQQEGRSSTGIPEA